MPTLRRRGAAPSAPCAIALVVAATALVVLAATGCGALLSAGKPARDPLASATPEDGLREALTIGTMRAVEALGRANGYLGNEAVKIPLPEKLRTIEKALRVVGRSQVVDDFVTSMNRAAEAAAPVAKDVFLGAVRAMTFRDAWTILRGKGHEATDYLRANAGPRLRELFLPIVSEKLGQVGATRDFDRLMARSAEIPFVGKPAFELDGYVADRALDGLFATLAQEEERIRKDPIARTTELLRKFFS
jgi:hypothetical protein